MAEPKSFPPAKLIVGIISSQAAYFERAEKELQALFGSTDLKSPLFPFDLTNYYEEQMRTNLERVFLSFVELVSPDTLSNLKIQTNALEKKIRQESGKNFRVVNIDPGILTASALIMATAKDFSHRIPLSQGIYGHLEFLFSKQGIKILDWTYPDFKREGYGKFFLEVRRVYLEQLRRSALK